MLVNIHHDSPAEHRRLLVAGVAFLTAVAMLVALSIAIYGKVFDNVTMVTIKAERAGLQLAKFGDVRVNGALVGQVREISQDGEEAEIRIALEPDAAREIPSNVEVQILPTTLFGQKFVSLIAPDQPSGQSIQEDDVIPSDRVETNVELNRILSNLFPLLRSVRPADLNTTLNALATALGGRGEQLGVTLDKLESYLGAIEDDLPTLRQDLVLLAEVADTYNVAAPDLLGVLDNLTVTSRTIIDQRRELDVFFGDVAGLARTSTALLEENEQNLIAIGELSAPLTQLLATYSPQYPCLLRGLANYQPRLAKVLPRRDDPAVLRVQHAPVPRVRPARLTRLRRGRPRTVVPRSPQPARTGRSAAPRRRHRHGRQPADEHASRHPARAEHRRWRRHRLRRFRGRAGDHQRPAGLAQRSPGRQLRRARLPHVRTRGPGRGGDMNRRDRVTAAAAVKLGIFTVCSVIVTGVLAAIMGNIGFGGGAEYQAVFSTASMLDKGDDVRIAGVNVGEVREVEHYDRTQALVTFRIKDEIQLSSASRAEIRFLNLVGDRYLALEEGSDSSAERLEPGDTIPIENTSPALDLTVLFNGFQPLFQALNPQQVNELSLNLVQVLQGEGGTVAGLVRKTASLTNTLADRDQLIGEVITNLGSTLETVDQRHEQLNELILELKGWMGDLARDRRTIGASLDNVSDLTVVVADLLQRSRPLVKDDIAAAAPARGTAQQGGEQQDPRGDARPAAGVDDRPGPDRDHGLLVQLLPVRVLREDRAPAGARGDPRPRTADA